MVYTKTKTTKKQKVDYRIGDLVLKTNTKTKKAMQASKNQNKQLHVPVLLEEVIKYLKPQTGEKYLDLTAGYGGHADKVLALTGKLPGSVLVDRDATAIVELQTRFSDQPVQIIQNNFLDASRKLLEDSKRFDLILADLGVASPHLNDAKRGFAINAVGPLDMRMDQTQELTAETVVNSYSFEQLVDILSRYGEEPKARQIAKLIVSNRPILTTSQLAGLAARVWHGKSRIHPATRTFQAIRIAVNDELRLLEESLPLWIQLLTPGGRLAIISFHSLEDRLVKQAFGECGGNHYDAIITELTKRPVVPGPIELVSNPRARSAKLRVCQRK